MSGITEGPEHALGFLGPAPSSSSVGIMTCPDGGFCHHECELNCFRVNFCGPLSGVYPNDEWPAKVREMQARITAAPRRLMPQSRAEAEFAVQRNLEGTEK